MNLHYLSYACNSIARITCSRNNSSENWQSLSASVMQDGILVRDNYRKVIQGKDIFVFSLKDFISRYNHLRKKIVCVSETLSF